MDSRCRVELLGGIRVRQDDRIITRFRTQKTAALLAYLAYRLGHAHPRELLAELIWPGSEPEASRTSLRVALSSLRRQLEPPGVPAGGVVIADRFSIQLNPRNVTTDVSEFEAALRASEEAADPSQRLHALARAVDLYGGPLLAGSYQDWAFPEQTRLADLFFQAARRLTSTLEDSGQLEAALDYAHRAIGCDPFREEAHQDVMRLLAALDQPEAALRQFDELRTVFREELGEEPSESSRELAELISRSAGSPGYGLPDSRTLPPRPSPGPRTSALPTGTVSFLLTDIEGSTRLGEKHRTAYAKALADHHRILRECFRRHGGLEVKELGDGFLVAFEHATSAVACAVDIRRLVDKHQWPAGIASLPVRLALHTGQVEITQGEYRGISLHHASRVLAAAHGGQVLLSETSAVLVHRDLEPGMRLVDLGSYRLRDIEAPERLFQLDDAETGSTRFPPPIAETAYGSHLPPTFTRFVGREQELDSLHALLTREGARLVTLTGPGGSGKTRLALEVAHRLVEPFRGAVWFVPLQDVTDPAQLPAAIAEAVGLPPLPGVDPLTQVTGLLARQLSLLVLDNVEHLVEEGATVIHSVLRAAETTKCLLTSRQRLNVDGEREFTVGPLPVPEAAAGAEVLLGCDSIRLFIDRAQAVRPDFQVTDGNAEELGELCRRLEGIPLALELAATRAQALTVSQMLGQLQDRFKFLVSRRRDTTERHRTLWETINWSYEILSPALQRFFAELSAFRGGWTMDAAEAVCTEPGTFELLLDLCDHSMVRAREQRGAMRYEMLESIREFADGCLECDARDELRARHAEYFLAFARDRDAKADGPDEARAFAELEAELGNIRAAMDWSLSQPEAKLFGEYAAALSTFLWRRGYWREHRQYVEAGLASAESASPRDPLLMTRLLHALVRLAYDQGDNGAAAELCQRGVALAAEIGETPWVALLDNSAALVLANQGEPDAAQSLLQEAVCRFRAGGDLRGEGMTLHNRGMVAYSCGDTGAARGFYEEALPVRERAGDVRGAAETQNNLALLSEEAGEFELAEKAYRTALRGFVQVDDAFLVAVGLCNIGEIAMRTGRVQEAVELLGPAEHALRHLGSVHAEHAARCLEEAARATGHRVKDSGSPWRQELFTTAQRLLEE